ncbi:MAG: S8 family serine peptidase [candidate division Zixibacteria bacterium]|nr:S8 family serine peptidase [candidate division Zixibacteria bacterium]
MERLMKKRAFFVLAFAAISMMTMIAGNAFAAKMYWYDKAFNREWELTPKTSEVMVKFDTGLASSDITEFENEFALAESHNAEWNRFKVYELKSEFDTRTVEMLSADNRVEAAAIPGIDHEGFIKYYDPTEATVQFHEYVAKEICEEIIAGIGAEIVREQWTPNYYTISTAEGKDVFETLAMLNEYPEVFFCEPSIYGFDDALWEPDDPNFDDQWHLYNTGQESGTCPCTPYSDHDINAMQSWDMTRGDRGVVIVVIDTGMDLTHPDLSGNLLARGGDDWDFADPDNSPDDEGNHGTACCGLAAAVANNNEGVAGVAPRAWLMPLRVNLSSGQNQNRADAINYARGRAADFDGMVISMSWRMSSGTYTAVENACNNAYNYNDVVLLAAAGNGNSSTVDYPGRYSSVAAVAATSPCDERKSTTSCDGEYWWGSNYGNDLDFAAPGVLMYTTDRQGSDGYSSGDYYDSFNGTSSACPTAAGVAALVRSANRDLTNAEVRNVLQVTADEVGGYTYSPKSYELGHGRVNAHAAVLEAMRRGLQNNFALDANMEALPDDYVNGLGDNWNVGGYFGDTYFGPQANILEESARGGYNSSSYPMNSWDAVLFSADEDMITCVFDQPTDSVQIAFAAASNELHLEAYDEDGNMVSHSSGVSGSGNSSFLSVTSDNEDIAYVVIHNSGNYFVVDDVMYAKDYPVRAYMLPTSSNPQITIPSGGGSYQFWGIIENNSLSNTTVDVGIHRIAPDGTDYLDATYNNIPVGPYQRLAFFNNMNVPGGAASGMWALRAVYGDIPSVEGAYQFGYYKSPSPIPHGEEITPYGGTEWSYEAFSFTVIGDTRDPLDLSRLDDLDPAIPANFALAGNYPNPFNPATNIRYQLPVSANVTLDIYNVLGQKVETLVNGYQEAGYHSVSWDASGYSSGVYFAKLSDGAETATQKMMLVK